ncbi:MULTISPECIES: DUF3301 domain-containing protein [unclassified Neptuniibacter]|jgi:hypothetical protein|uniref:DUF3301 domain-containing protein n=1 Tax=unclassified Neptuniibacter TaxID=2630693 RepID=UPI0026E42FCF|nr:MULTISPECIES: DUF3301 domain-containing protein [unclassified Neptuniibacter]MDO6513095.1 DUF3301 domain-containing protein [Neptuniibacter sp. 2_MG-2023]MDO6592493.1 DUF3301 domain-containing protein [Neptuniibacter sp. 1_MG-2023]
MYIDLQALIIVTLFAYLFYHWWQSQKVKEVALNRIRRQCKELDLQLLDDNINLSAFWLKRAADGKIRIWRSYNFEFSSTGEERYSGRVTTLGYQITDVHLDPHILH